MLSSSCFSLPGQDSLPSFSRRGPRLAFQFFPGLRQEVARAPGATEQDQPAQFRELSESKSFIKNKIWEPSLPSKEDLGLVSTFFPRVIT